MCLYQILDAGEEKLHGSFFINGRTREKSLADMYGENMYLYPDLMEAHRKNDIAVMQSYDMPIKETTEETCVGILMQLYKDKVGD